MHSVEAAKYSQEIEASSALVFRLPATGHVHALLPARLLLLFARDRRAVDQLSLAQLLREEEGREGGHSPHHVVGNRPGGKRDIY